MVFLSLVIFKKAKEEGVYFFGGQEENGNINNEIRILKIGMKPCKWIIPETKGSKPEGRYLHSMHYMKQQNVLIIYGGKSKGNKILGDVYAFDLTDFTWA